MTAGIQSYCYDGLSQLTATLDPGVNAAYLNQYPPGGVNGCFTTSAQSNSTSITLSFAFTALTFTQTSTGNTVQLPASPVNGQICGFSISNNVTNLTVSSAGSATVNNGAATATTSAGASVFWIYGSAATTWYPYTGLLSK